MNDIDRRKLLVGSGLALALGGCDFNKEGGKRKKSLDPFRPGIKVFEPDWNQGDKPWWSEKPPSGSRPFAPKHVALIYVNLRAYPKAKMDVIRVHFPASGDTIDPKDPNDPSGWEKIKSDVAIWIDHLNGASLQASPGMPPEMPQTILKPVSSPMPQPPVGTPTPTPAQYFEHGPTENSCWAGMSNFAFNDQHHVVIYIRNDGMKYDPDYPIWFGKSLTNKVLGFPTSGKKADENRCFYLAKPRSVTLSKKGWSDQVVHFNNYYQFYNGSNYVGIKKEHLIYSLSINGWLEIDATSGMQIIFDPDTGNMGEGQP